MDGDETMSTPFGPQLIGETEKTLSEILRHTLSGTGLTESHWVTLRLAAQLDGAVNAEGLKLAVADRAHFADAPDLVRVLTERGLLEGGRLTTDARRLIESVQATIAETTAPIWDNLPADDVAATGRLLNEIVTRARHVLADHH
jgi:hypothetical protein